MSALRRLAPSLCAVAAALIALALAAAPAAASKGHVFLETFGSAAKPSFGVPAGMAVDQAGGDLLVIDLEDQTLSRWNEDGTPSNFSALSGNVIDGHAGEADEVPGLEEILSTETKENAIEAQVAVAPPGAAGGTAGNIYVTNAYNEVVDVFAPSGAYLGQISAGYSCGVAVAPNGDVYVGDYYGGVHRFVPSGPATFTETPNSPFEPTSTPCQVAAGAGPTEGFVFATGYFGQVTKIDSDGAEEGETPYTDPISSAPNTTVTVDPATGHLYVAKGSEVKEFDASGASSATLVTAISAGSAVEGVAVRGSNGNLYISRSGAPNLDVFQFVTFPGISTEPATAVDSTSATLNGTVNPDGVALTDCIFEYGTTTAYAQTAPCVPNPAGIGTGTSPVAVEADLTGLDIGTVYHFRLKAANANGPVLGDDVTFQTLGPRILATWVEDVVRTEAVLKAAIDPEGKATTYHFEYTTTDFADCGLPANAACLMTPELAVGSDSTVHEVTRLLQGLQPGTTYYFRVVATNPDTVNEGPDRTFTTYAPFTPDAGCPNQELRVGPSSHLPDCRAYEMVSPIDKNGGDIDTTEEEIGFGSRFSSSYRQASIEGGKVTFSSATAFGDAIGGHWSNQYIATRGPKGWSTHSISARRGQAVFEPEPAFAFNKIWSTYSFFQGFSPDLSSAWVRDANLDPLTPDALEGYVNLYRRDDGTDSYEALTNQGPLGTHVPPDLSRDGSSKSGGLRFLGASEDLRHQVFAVTAPLTPDAVPVPGPEQATSQLYDLVDGELHLVSVLPNGDVATANSFAGTASASVYGRTREQMLKNAVSSDGSRVVWTATSAVPGSFALSGPGTIYVRGNPGEEQSASGECDEPGKACTIHVAGTTSDFSTRAQFWAASDSGSHVLYSVGSHPNRTLHLFNVDTGTSTEDAGEEAIAGEVLGVSATAEDMSHVYFVSKEALAGGAVAGEYNLYLYRLQDDAYTHVTPITDDDVGQSAVSQLLNGTESYVQDIAGIGPGGQPEPYLNQTRISPDGRYFAFLSNSSALSESTAGYDNTDLVTGKPDFEVFRYDAATEQLSCVSCNPSGVRPRGHLLRLVYSPFEYEFTDFPDLRVAASIPTPEHDNYASRVLSDDGQRLFFHSDEALLPRDVNGIQDVYQWQAPGSGSCDVGDADYFARNDGCISLISTGRDEVRSEFVDAAPAGEEVYISTDESLDPRDPGLRDIYVAKAGGGFPPPSPTAPCEGEACQTPPPPPSDPTPASSTFQGPGDPRQGKPPKPRCPKGKRRVKTRNGKTRCVKPKRNVKRTKKADNDRRAGR